MFEPKIDIMVAAEILSGRTPASTQMSSITGQTLPVTGNAYYGFKLILPCGEKRDLFHYAYNPVFKT